MASETKGGDDDAAAPPAARLRVMGLVAGDGRVHPARRDGPPIVVAVLELAAPPASTEAYHGLAVRHGQALAGVLSPRAWLLHVALPLPGSSVGITGVLIRLGSAIPATSDAPLKDGGNVLFDTIQAELDASAVPAGTLVEHADGRFEFRRTVPGTPDAQPLYLKIDPPDAKSGEEAAGKGGAGAGAGDFSGTGADVPLSGAGAGGFSGTGARAPLSSAGGTGAVGPVPLAAAPAVGGAPPGGASRPPLTKLEDLLR
jgi:hypothetical protein